MMENVVEYINLKKTDYLETWNLQEKSLKEVIDARKGDEKHGLNKIFFCEHNQVFTIGKSGDMNNLLATEQELSQEDIQFYKVNRGGDITYHGPGQITGYFIFDLYQFGTDLHKFIRNIEKGVINFLKMYGVEGFIVKGRTGVWVKSFDGVEKKICAIGIRCSRWVTMHGIAFNVSNRLLPYEMIIPCGISDKGVTNLELETKKKIDIELVKEQLLEHFKTIFNLKIKKA